MTRPFFSRDRISHFELFDRHAGKLVARVDVPAMPGTDPLFIPAEAALDKMSERLRAGYAIDFQVCMKTSQNVTVSTRPCPGSHLPLHPRFRNRVPLRRLRALPPVHAPLPA